MACCSCGLRQRKRINYCEQCGCPIGALAPPPALDRRDVPPQQLRLHGTHVWKSGDLALLGVFFGCLGWMPLYIGMLACLLAVLLGGTAVQRARHARRGHPAHLWLAWVPVVMGGMGAVCTFAGL